MAPDALGPTLMHEHLLCDITPPHLAESDEPEVEIRLANVWEIRHHWCVHRGNNRLDDATLLTEELRDFTQAGGSAIVELTTVGIAPNRSGLAELSRASGVPIVAGCGFYTDAFLPAHLKGRPTEFYARAMVEALAPHGSAPAGIIGEIGCSDVLTETERRVLAAAADAQRETGAAINVHPSRRPAGLFEAVDILAAAGADLSRVVMSHIDRTLFSEDELLRLADTGVVIEYDFFGIESSYYPFDLGIDLPNDAQRVAWIRWLADRGYLGQVTLSQDICTRTRLRRRGGHGYGHLITNVIPLLRRRGFSDREIDILTIATPRRLLTLP
jgi:phosphotriesterase-related protein